MRTVVNKDSVRVSTELVRKVCPIVKSSRKAKDIHIVPETAELFQLLSAAASGGLALLEGERLLQVNEGVAELFGYHVEDLVETSFFHLISPKDRDVVEDLFAKGNGRLLVDGVCQDGTVVSCEIERCEVSFQGHSVQILKFDRVVDQPVVEFSGRESEDREEDQALRPLGTWEYVPKTGGFTWSAEMYGLFRRDLELGVPAWEDFATLVHSDDVKEFLATLSDALEGKARSVDVRTHRDLGPLRYLSVVAQGVRYPDTSGVHLLGTVTDRTEQRLAGKRLEVSHARYRRLFEAAPIGIGLSEADGRILLFNDAMIKPGGYAREDIDRCPNVGAYYADSSERDRVLSIFEKQGQLNQHEVKFRCKDGGSYQAALSLSRVRIGGRKLVVSTVEDITKRKRAEQALKESETRFRSLIENSYDVITLFDQNGSIQYVSPSIRRVLGYAPEELVGRPGLELVHPEDIELANADYLLGLREPGLPQRFRYRLRHRDGSYRFVEATGQNLLGQPGVRALVSNFQDITERHAAERELEQSEAQSRALFEQTPFGIYRADVGGRLLAANPALVRMLGYGSTEELLELVDLAHDVYADPRDHEQLIEDYRALGKVRAAEVQWKRRDGGLITVRLNGRVLLDESENLVGFEMIADDVTRERALEDQLRHAQKLEALGQLTGGIAHDFNNILTTIQGNAELAMERVPASLNDLCSEVVEIRKAAQRGADLVRRLLVFSRKESLQFEPVDLSQVCGQLTTLLRHVVPENLEVIVQSELNGEMVQANPGAIEQILINLVSNARDAMPEGGVLTIQVSPVKIDRRFVVTRQVGEEGEYVRISVSDNGAGMDEETMRKAFDPFFTTKPAGKGTGLGLSTTYGLVQEHRGFLHVDSQVGQGTVVDVYLPKGSPGEERQPIRQVGASMEGTETVLVVEDEPSVLRLAQGLLQRDGYQVLVASDGAEALELIRGNRQAIHLILADLVMPRLGGEVLYHEAIKACPDCKFIFMSGYADGSQDPYRTVDSSVPILAKPWRAAELRRIVRETLDSRAQQG